MFYLRISLYVFQQCLTLPQINKVIYFYHFRKIHFQLLLARLKICQNNSLQWLEFCRWALNIQINFKQNTRTWVHSASQVSLGLFVVWTNSFHSGSWHPQSRKNFLGIQWDYMLLMEEKPWSQDWLIAAGAYPGFCSMKRLEVFSRNLSGFPNNLPVPIYTPGWREALWE